MRVNTNIAAMTALRNLDHTSRMTQKNLQRLSSGQKINSAADSPAGLMISESMRAQISGLEQATKNSETSIAMVQTAEGALNEVSNILVNMRQLAIHAANEGANDEKMLEADQNEIENLLFSIDQIAKNTQFGTKTLLDGSTGASGVAVGDGLVFVEATDQTKPSPERGYAVNITQVATRAIASGSREITVNDAREEMSFVINEGGKTASLSTSKGEIHEQLSTLLKNHDRSPELFTAEETSENIRELVARHLQRKTEEAGLQVDVYIDESGMLTVRHREFGGKPSFSITGNVDGVFSAKANEAVIAEEGKDVAGLIDGELAFGDGQFLVGAPGTPAEGLKLKFDKVLGTKIEEVLDPETNEVISKNVVKEDNNTLVGGDVEGYIHVSQQSLGYQVGPNFGQQIHLSLTDIRSNKLSRSVENSSGFGSLSDIDVTNSDGSQNSILMIDGAISEISNLRAKLGSFQKNALETNLNYLKVATENLSNSESIIRDADMAAEMSDFTKNQIMLASGTAMAAQANQIPKSVLQLLNGAQ
ncbi:MAG: flagellin [SAR324 cluster bacterium]|nr:flagellin [SAR324 cluster bacterium]